MDLIGLRLGGFVLGAPLARGAMGEVWRATHEGSGLTAAVKVVGDATPELAAALQREIRASAGLAHPHIVQLYDAGELDAPARGLAAGVPWLAMELLEGGVLSRRRIGWEDTRQVLGDLLDALAHAHARGLLHRDLKPDNVMFDALGGTRLVDFGIGVRLDEGRRIRPSGTPTWMAPEQFERDGRHLGPWTDLYALGCIAFWMASGSPPFAGDTIPAMRRAHASSPLPPLRSTFEVPDGFEAWIARLTAKSPRERFRRARDAHDALDRLPDPAPDAPTRRQEPAAATLVPSAWGLDTFDAPAITAEAPRPLPPAIAGLGLVRLREAPLMGRAREQALLARLFDDVAAGATRTVVISGPSGAGKSRLVTWLCREVHASGRGTPFRAAHASGHGDGLAGLLARALRLDASASAEVVRERIAEEGLPAPLVLAEILRPSAGGQGAPLERACGLVADALHTLAEGRVPVVWIDDAQWGAEACALARHLAQRPGWLVILAVRGGAEAFPDAVHVPLGPLAAEDALDLVAGMASFDGPTRDLLVRHTEGSPLFLVELVGEWIGRGLLAAGPAGWRLTGAGEAWPGDLPALWRSRLLRVLERRGEWSSALAIAAALGADVDGDELVRASDGQGHGDPSEAVALLLAERLAVPDPAFEGRRWSFVHPSLREAVLELADERALLEDAHRACARMLASGSPATELRRAAHLEAAGDVGEAVDALLVARAWLMRRDLDAASAAADRAEALLAGLPGDFRRHGELAVARARVALFRGDREAVERGAAIALASPDPRIRALGRVEVGRAHRLHHREAEASAALREAIDELRALGDLEQLSIALAELAIGSRAQGRVDEAEALLAEATELTTDATRRLEFATMRAGLLILGDRPLDAIAALERFEDELRRPDRVFPRAQWLYHRAFARAVAGAWIGAEADAAEAVRLRYGMGGTAWGWVQLWAHLLARNESWAELDEVMRVYQPAPADAGDRSIGGLVLAARGAVEGDWEAVRDGLGMPPDRGLPPLASDLLERVAERADQAGQAEVAALARAALVEAAAG